MFERFIEQLPEERKEAVIRLRTIVLKKLPKGFIEIIHPNSLEYVIPHSLYPPGYHCNPKLPLPFISILSQKSVLAIHHMGLYASPELVDWFAVENSKLTNFKIELGKGCIKIKRMDQIPYSLIGMLITKISVKDWIQLYERTIKK